LIFLLIYNIFAMVLIPPWFPQ